MFITLLLNRNILGELKRNNKFSGTSIRHILSFIPTNGHKNSFVLTSFRLLCFPQTNFLHELKTHRHHSKKTETTETGKSDVSTLT